MDLEGKDYPTESIPICKINTNDFTDIEWEESTFFDYLVNYKYLFIIIDFNNNKEKNITKVIEWQIINDEELNEAKKVWLDTKEKFLNGIKLEEKKHEKKNIIKNNLIAKSENWFCHVRPKARNSSDTYITPAGDKITKQCFWINNTYFRDKITKS